MRMPIWKIQGGPNQTIAKELCAKHYMRQRRTGDATIKRKPGPKPQPKPQGKIDPLMAGGCVGAARGAGSRQLHAELIKLRRENLSLRMQLAQAQRPRRADVRDHRTQLDVRFLQNSLSESPVAA
jgi:hypothetical protein